MKSLRIMVPLLVALTACQCGERSRMPEGSSGSRTSPTQSQAALDPGARSSLPLGTQCAKVLPPADLETMCDLKSVQVTDRGVVRHDCQRRFNVGGDERSLLVLWATNELDEASARLKFERGEAEAKTRQKYVEVPGLGFTARTYFRTFGAGDDFRRMHVMEAYSGPFSLKLELPRHPDVRPLCAAEKLPELARRVFAQIKGLESGVELPGLAAKAGEHPAAAPAPATGATGATAAADKSPDKAPRTPGKAAEPPAAASKKVARPAAPQAKAPTEPATKK